MPKTQAGRTFFSLNTKADNGAKDYMKYKFGFDVWGLVLFLLVSYGQWDNYRTNFDDFREVCLFGFQVNTVLSSGTEL